MAVTRVTQVLLTVPFLLLAAAPSPARPQQAVTHDALIPLPAAATDGSMSVERAMATRRSQRDLTGAALSLSQLSQLLWSAQGITRTDPDPQRSRRTAPSAGATYPMEIYAVVGAVEGLVPGVYRYVPAAHALAVVAEGDARAALFESAGRQAAIQAAPVTLALAAAPARTAARYRERTDRYVAIEVGAVAENIHLQVESLDLGTVFMGSFRDADAKAVLRLPDDQVVLGLMPVGRVNAPR